MMSTKPRNDVPPPGYPFPERIPVGWISEAHPPNDSPAVQIPERGLPHAKVRNCPARMLTMCRRIHPPRKLSGGGFLRGGPIVSRQV